MKAHGGDIYSAYDLKYADRLVDFSANINPLGMPERAKAAIRDNIEAYYCYPDTEYRELRNAISEFEKIDAANISCGNGAADIIFRIAYGLKPKKALVPAPAFSEYEQALTAAGCEVSAHSLSEAEGFSLGQSFIDSVQEDTDIIFVCNPNNPTGRLTDKGTLTSLLEKAKSCGAILVIDECFMDFVTDGENYSMKQALAEADNLIILRAFTKIFAMAGVRLGYMLCSDEKIRAKISASSQPWNVSTVASKCGAAALSEEGWIERTAAYIAGERRGLLDGLKELGLMPLDSAANYILFKSQNTKLYDELLPYGILIRRCSNFRNLDEHWYRIAVKSSEDNAWLLKCLRELKEKGVLL